MLLHEVAPAEGIARTVEAEHRDLDVGQMGNAKLFRLPRRVKRIGEEQQAATRKPVRRQH